MSTIENSYDIGQLVRVKGIFTNPDSGAALDPTAVTFSFRNPNGATTTYTYGVGGQLVRDSLGHFHVDINASIVGRWYWRWASTGAGQAARDGSFEITASPFV